MISNIRKTTNYWICIPRVWNSFNVAKTKINKFMQSPVIYFSNALTLISCANFIHQILRKFELKIRGDKFLNNQIINYYAFYLANIILTCGNIIMTWVIFRRVTMMFRIKEMWKWKKNFKKKCIGWWWIQDFSFGH